MSWDSGRASVQHGEAVSLGVMCCSRKRHLPRFLMGTVAPKVPHVPSLHGHLLPA